MRKIKFLPIFIFSAILALASCQSDDIDSPNNNVSSGETDVTLHLSVQAPSLSGSVTRAAEYENGSDGEFMRNWIILIVRNDSIKRMFTSNNYDGERSEDYTERIRLQNGTYSFYSFANLSLDSLGLTSSSQTLPDGFDSRALRVEGNQQSIAGFPNGIPMSNKQDITVGSTTSTVDLSVIRMVAKVRVEVTNTSNWAIRVHSLAIRDITKNPGQDTLNLKLIPGSLDSNSDTGKRNTNLNTTNATSGVDRETYVYTVPTDSQRIASHSSRSFTFYVNESEANDSTASRFLGKHFILEVRTGVNSNANATTPYNARVLYTYNDWGSMARNELHVLPVSLERYRIDLFVRPYTAIGVLPMYSTDAEIETINLGLYGHYDIVPRLRDITTGTYYYLVNSTRQQGRTVSLDSITTNGNEVTRTSNYLRIDSLKLLTNSNNLGIVYSYEGWGENPDGSGTTTNLPEVGWNGTAATPRIECRVGNYTGSAIYTVNSTFYLTYGTYANQRIHVSRRFRISNTYADLSQLAKKRR